MTETLLTAAPGAQEHPSLALVNSAGNAAGGRGYDELSTPEAATAWLAARDLVRAEAVLYEHCQGRLVTLRADLRDLFTAHTTGDAPTTSAVHGLNSALTSVPGALLLRFDPQAGFTRRADHPVTQVVEHVMAVIADDAASLLSGDQASQLASCEADSCQRFFVRTHARRQWCSTRCGDRVRAARAYSRKRAIPSAQVV
ncbi:CGNR zinc finger domain-containing protein [Arthrobacter tumbae]|uniref:CGNR zinc finger domain-containing protein n=1 Tax=Arthrobacter tumbae TaxID=163874 RepID=UPI001EF7DBCB|nr:CGNR zinc finger domain-containing protein [Arthrobacter tumbae]MBM7780850.1 putative RNA-binding Zn ribbon-like protein [Arthrobacter tumbae]